ncbi:hypothetical protein KIK06_26330 [Nocardiopsis sp. EMB25]|uniref:hypothetical protein n=1 Tax=Nocardiopsis sp. EMB25 TaxID=2835867 RepID=UPI00228358B6|nr:hypothetical protein [Nocardiopsis sp. EMB25]MCY9787403.1 hypothetical protein [Nocardiopsis sp. EMB25]
MKFDVVEPGEEQAMLPESEQGTAAERAIPEAAGEPQVRPGVHPRLVRASASMHRRVKADLVTLESSLNRLGQAITAAQRSEPSPDADAAPPRNFRAGAFSRRG